MLILVIRETASSYSWRDTRGMQLGFDTGNESDGYRFTLGGYSGDAGRY